MYIYYVYDRMCIICICTCLCKCTCISLYIVHVIYVYVIWMYIYNIVYIYMWLVIFSRKFIFTHVSLSHIFHVLAPGSPAFVRPSFSSATFQLNSFEIIRSASVQLILKFSSTKFLERPHLGQATLRVPLSLSSIAINSSFRAEPSSLSPFSKWWPISRGRAGIQWWSMMGYTKSNLAGGFKPSERYESQLGWLFPMYGKIKKTKTNHQPVPNLPNLPNQECRAFFILLHESISIVP